MMAGLILDDGVMETRPLGSLAGFDSRPSKGIAVVPFDGRDPTNHMSLTPDEIYHCHVKNLRAVNSALVQIYRQLKYCLAAQQDVAADALLKTFCLLIGAWAEVRLLKVLYEPSGFSGTDRTKILAPDNTQVDRWKLALELGFRKKYKSHERHWATILCRMPQVHDTEISPDL